MTNLCPTCHTPLERRDYPYVDPTELNTVGTGTMIVHATFQVAHVLVCTLCQKVVQRLDGQPDEQTEELTSEQLEQLLEDLLKNDEDEDDEEDNEEQDADEQPIEAGEYTSPLHTGPLPPLGDTSPSRADLVAKLRAWREEGDEQEQRETLDALSDLIERHFPGKHRQKEHGDWAHKGHKAGSSPTGTGQTSGRKRHKGPKLTKMERLQRSLQSKIKQYERLAHRKLGKHWTVEDQKLAEKIADDLQSVLKALKGGHAAGMALVRQLLADAEKLHDAAPKAMSAHRIKALENLIKRMSKVAGPSRVAMPQMMRWKDNCGCDICKANANVVREVGQPYPSGHTVPAAHSGCECTLVPIQEGEEDHAPTI
jgi:hypothetical protein